MNTELTDAEQKAVVDDVNKIYLSVINQLIATADKHDVERDSMIAYFGQVFSVMSEISTFENWEVSK